MQNSNLRVSVVIPTYNAGEHIGPCLKSVKDQEGMDPDQIEILVVDDCSTDNTWGLVQKAGVQHFQNSTNLGLTRNWNKAVELASGSIVIQLHQDDRLQPGTLKAAMGIFKDPNVALVAFSQINDAPVSWKECRSFTGKAYFQYLLTFQECPPPSCTFFRKDLLKGPPFYDPAYSYCPEFDLYLRLAQDNPNGLFVQDERPLIIRGSSEGQFSKNNFHSGLIDKIHLLDEYKGALSDEARKLSSKGLVHTIDRGIAQLLDQGRSAQVRAMFQEPRARIWLVKNFLKLKRALRTGLSRTIRK